MSEPLYVTTRARATTRRLLRNTLLVFLAMAYFLYLLATGARDVFAWAGAIVGVLLFLSILTTVLVSRVPLEIHADKVVIRTVMTNTIQSDKLTGFAVSPRTGQPALAYDDPEKGHKGPIPLPWRFIAEPPMEVIAAIQEAYGFDSRGMQA